MSDEFPQFNRLKTCRYGQLLYNVHDMYIGRSLDLYGEWSQGEVDLFRQMVRPGQVVLEIGANIGAHTVFFAHQVGPRGRVLAFEPQRIVFQSLCANLALNSLTNVDALWQAVGAERGELIVPPLDYTQENNFGGLALGDFTFGERVTTITIDSLGLSRCHLIKVDVEGMEQAVLEGARETVTRFKPLLYVENDRREKAADLIRLIDSLGYAMYWHAPPLFNPNNFFGHGQNAFGQIVSMNMLCVHRDVPQKLDGFQTVEVPR